MQRCVLIRDASDVLIEGAVRRFDCFDMCGVFVLFNSLFLLSECCMLCKRAKWVCGMLQF